MTSFERDKLFQKIRPYLPQHLSDSLTEGINTDDALAISIHLASLRYIISTYLPRYLVELITKDPQPGQVEGGFRFGTVMFADVSGFTAMSERLSALGKEGAEEITGIVNDYFDTMLEISANYGGDLLKFGGDALLLFFEGDDGALRAVATANAMQQAMSRFSHVKTSQGVFPLRMSIGMGSGPIFLASLGTAENMEYAVMGRALANMAQAEDRAVAGQIMVDQATCDAAREIAAFTPAGDNFRLFDSLIADYVPPKVQSRELTPLPLRLGADVDELLPICVSHVSVIEGLRPFVPERLLARLIIDPQRPTLPGSHRPVTVMFLNFYGIDEIIETLGPAHERAITQILNTHFVTMSRILTRYEGVVNKVDTYAIGHRIMALFGALRAHEDDPQRAVRAALEMNHALVEVNRRTCEILSAIPNLETDFGVAPLKQRIGLNTGFVFAGNVGSAVRHEYSVMGDEVNLTARLMSVAQEGEVLISRSMARHTESEFILEEKEAVKVKGKTTAVRNFIVTAERERPQRWANLQSSPIVGRDSELQTGQEIIAHVLKGRGHILIINGVSGIGKTRLAEEIAFYAEQEGMELLAGTCLSYGKTMTYHPWADILRAYFGLKHNDDAATRLEAVNRGMAAIAEAEWSPVIGEVMGLDIPDNNLTRTLDAKLRRQRVLDLTVKLLRSRAQTNPLMVIVEDAHWADPASMDLINYVARNIAGHPIALVLPHRPDDGLPNWTTYDYAVELSLADLPEAACLEIVAGMIGPIRLPDSLCQLILGKGGGNPFFVEEVVRVLIDSGALQEDEAGHWRVVEGMADVELPDTVHGMIISRIDRLLETDRHILQVASVVGRVFNFQVLDGIYAYSDRDGAIRIRLNYLGELGLTELQAIETLLYRFKHLTTREVVYESLSFEQRRDFHRKIAAFLERNAAAGAIGEQTDLLAYHYFEGQDWQKAVEYNLMAARHAQREFANDSAVDSFERVLEAASRMESPQDVETERLIARQSLGEVLTLLGRYDEALTHYAAAREMVEAEPWSIDQTRHLADLCRHTADVYERRSEFDVAFEWLNKGLGYLNEDEPTIEASQIYLLGAGVYRRQGKNEEAITWCEKSLTVAADIKTREGRQSMAQAYYNLAGIYTRYGDLRRAVQFCRQSVQVYEEIDDSVGLSHAYNNLGNAYSDQGDWERAVESFHKSLAIKQKIGDVLYQAFINNNLGNIYLYRGEWDKAADLFARSTAIWKQVGAALPEGVTLSNLAQVYIYQQNWDEAKSALERSRGIFAAIDSQDFMPELERRWAEYFMMTGDIEQALTRIHRSIELAVEGDARLEEGMSCRMLGLVQMSQGQTGPAQIALERSLKILTQLDSEYETAKTRLALARLLWAVDRASAQAHLQQARAAFEKLGAAADLSAARALEKR